MKTIYKNFFALAFVLGTTTLRAFATDYYVDNANGLDTYTGTQWNVVSLTGPFKTIDKALALAAAAPAGSTTNIYVKSGSYTMASTAYTFTNKSLLLKGGFPAIATGTDISGYAVSNTTTLAYSSTQNSITVKNSLAGPFAISIQGFTQTGLMISSQFFAATTATEKNTAFSFTDMSHNGGVQYQTYNLQNLDNSNTIAFNNCSFNGLDNSLNSNGNTITLVNSACTPSLTGCTFNNNTAANGIIYLATNTANPLLSIASDCVFTNNTGGGQGGVFYLDNNTGNLVLSNITAPISGNTANQGGVIAYSFAATQAGTVTIANCTLTNNEGSTSGGVIYLPANRTAGTINLNGSNFISNTSNGNGGVLSLGSAPLTISNSNFSLNTAGNSGGVIFENNVTTLPIIISGSSFTDNVGGFGGVININSAPLTVTSSNFCSNSTSNNGGMLVTTAQASATSFNNCVFNNNNAGRGGAIEFNGSNTLAISNSTMYKNASLNNGGFLEVTAATTCTFQNNVLMANNAAVSGGRGGALMIQGNTATIVTACNFSQNSSDIAGAINQANAGTLTINGGCVFDSNHSTSVNGAILSNRPTSIDRTIFRKNYANNNPADIAVTGSDVQLTVTTSPITNSQMQQSPLSVYGTGSHAGSTTNGNSAIVAATVAPVGCTSANLVILPVILTSFTATVNGCTGSLYWQTASEAYSSFYIVEASADGSNFNQVAKVASSNSPTGAHYSYAHALSGATTYFRLKTVDIDGRFTYSHTVMAKSTCNINKGISVYPSPVIDMANISGLARGTHVSLFNNSGIKLTELIATGTSLAISMQGYASGIYMLGIQATDGTVSNIKLVKGH